MKNFDNAQMNKSSAAKNESAQDDIDSIYINQNEGSNLSGECTPELSQPFKFQPGNAHSKKRGMFHHHKSLKISDL